MELCHICPRRCGADRSSAAGFCGESDTVRVARAALHPWEEPCISGTAGSGTVFFSGCSLRCVFCQNRAVSRGEKGRAVGELADIFFQLRDSGAVNINLVTPTHFTPQIVSAIRAAKTRGFDLPFVWNSSGYECPEALRSLEGLIDVWLPDFKYVSRVLSGRYSGAPDYFENALSAITEMKRQTPDYEFRDGLIKKGVLIRHLVLPGCTGDSLDVMDAVRESFGAGQYVSVMSQYTPFGEALPDELNRTVTPEEYEKVTSYALLIGLRHGYFQEGGAAAESFIPEFK